MMHILWTGAGGYLPLRVPALFALLLLLLLFLARDDVCVYFSIAGHRSTTKMFRG